MIESRYNYFVPEGDDVICLNGISRKIFLAKKEQYAYIKDILASEERQIQEPKIVKELLKMHFLIEDNQKEIDYLIDLNRKHATSSLYHLVINPTQDCIFRCWYCYETHKESKMTDRVLANIKKMVLDILDRPDIDRFMLGWFGGEPLMYFYEVVYPLSMFIKQETEKRGKRFFCNMTTNGFLLTEDVVIKCKEFNLNSLQITLDGDERNHNKTRNRDGEPSFQTILENSINYCSYSSNNQLVLRINYTDKIIQTDFSKVLERIPIDIRPRIDVQFKRVWQTYETKTMKTPLGLLENMDNLKRMNFKLTCGTEFGFVRGCLCYADRQNYVNINFDGKAYKCTAMDYNTENSLGYLDDNGKIVFEQDRLMGINDKPYFEDTKCMECNLLPICGGPCFMRKYQSVTKNMDFCVKSKLDTNLDMFVKEYFYFITNK